MESEGWPTEFASEEERDRVAFAEKKSGHALQPEEITKTDTPELVRKLQDANKRGEIRRVKKYGD